MSKLMWLTNIFCTLWKLWHKSCSNL